MTPPLAFEVSGPPTAPAVLLLHGFMGSRLDWVRVAEVLARTHRCIAVDLPGHGETGDTGTEGVRRTWPRTAPSAKRSLRLSKPRRTMQRDRDETPSFPAPMNPWLRD